LRAAPGCPGGRGIADGDIAVGERRMSAGFARYYGSFT